MSKITRHAKGQQCQVRIPGICCFDDTTTVFAHLNGGGMGIKCSDLHGAFACHTCHAWLDREYVKTFTKEQRDLAHYEAMHRTQIILLRDKLIILR